MFPSTRTTPWKGGYAKFRRWSVALLRFYVLRCYNWLRAEGRIFRDRSSGKLTTRFRGVCQLYRISEILGHTRLDPQEPSKYVDRRVHTWRTVRRRKAKLGGTHTAADRNHRFDERNANTREDTSVLHLKMLRVWKSVVPSIRASLSLSLSLSFSFVLCVLRVYLCLDENRAFRDSLLNINVDDEPAVLSRHEKYLKKSSDIDFFNLPRMQKMEGKKTADCISSKKHPDIVFPGRNFLVRNIEKRPTLLSGLSVSFNAEEKQKYSPSKIK